MLSRDGSAAVLTFARTVLEHERCIAPHRFAASLQVFAFRVERAVQAETEDLHRGRVFIAPLFRAMSARGELTSCPTLAAFKGRLLRAHRRGLITLAKCKQLDSVNPLMVTASAVRRGRVTYHLVRRWSRRRICIALSDTLDALPRDAYAATEDFARKVHDDELRREGRPRLVTVGPKEFAERVQEVTNEDAEDALVEELYRTLDERGELTGMTLEEFQAWVRASHEAGLIVLRASTEGGALDRVQRTAAPRPIPWGRPPLPVRPPSPRRPDF
ncbi:hypothetical protein [Polyangium aurulentum]|uniref:hypothetical protein n=1 Tax=Polyangium aurulentum TaxID=2567896 RepID=UPI0010AE84B0|nr:hypothetical protein [Polyangium aurulentum]UQA59486.1 hypothetical protein E8A73_002955 [Polyangium aurulentum]